VLSLLQALERRPELVASTARDFLLFNCCDDRREVLEVARRLRSLGFSTARDIIRRELDSSLEYARRMNIRCMLVIGEGLNDGIYRAIRTSDGKSKTFDRDTLDQDRLKKFIEKNQGE
jgi:ATP phosphoribosyltransferase regulatory subunit